MILPNYKDGSIVNLMSSIASAFNAKSMYNELKILPGNKLKDSKNIVLIVIDGMGYDYLKENSKILSDYLIGPMTSFFPATTTAAIPTFLTGVAPQQHGLTGWYIFLKEIGVLSKIFTFSPRVGGESFTEHNVKFSDIFNIPSFTKKIKAKNFIVTYEDITKTDFTKATAENAKIIGYKDLKKIRQMLEKVKKAIKSGKQRKYIFAYWPVLDRYGHEVGISHETTKKHFREIEKDILDFFKSINGTNTSVIITADHGFVDTPKEKTLYIDDFPGLKECLVMPLTGERRSVYCYVKPDKIKQFKKYVKQNLSKYCDLYSSKELVKKNCFGLFNPNPKLLDRIGYYTLIFKENYMLKDKIKEDPKEPIHVGHHGGVSRAEMLVPLILVKC